MREGPEARSICTDNFAVAVVKNDGRTKGYIGERELVEEEGNEREDKKPWRKMK